MLALQVDPGRRPDTLSIAEFVRLSAVARVSAARAPDAGVEADQDDDDDDEDLTPRSQGDHE
jgi:hypothetical protein